MPRMRMFLDINVVEAARERVRHVYDTFDTVCVQVSGGKDSTAALLLAKEIHEERDLGPVKVIFRDEEMVSPAILRYLEWIREQPWVDMEWYCLPQGQEIWVLGKREYVLLWSAMREAQGRLTRPIPPWAITAEHFGLRRDTAIPESIDYYTMQGKTGQVAFITGVRAAESMIRYRSCVQKLSENYIVRPYRLKKSVPLRFAKVIYDWSIDDVFKFIDEHDFPYCDYYDLAAMTKSNTRVGIPLHSVAIRRIGDVVATEPEFYDRLYECFPHIDAQRRWWSSFDMDALIADYASYGWDGVRNCIDDNMLTPGVHQRAMSFAAEFRKKSAKDPFSYPIEALIRTLLLNEFYNSAATPVGPKTRAHTMRMAALQSQEDAEADAEDLQDDMR
jgi:3'-phosphoadenosine 5'-phosphosulfate sulfotransferase (PAPS reductase)/FAD synthetase